MADLELREMIAVAFMSIHIAALMMVCLLKVVADANEKHTQ